MRIIYQLTDPDSERLASVRAFVADPNNSMMLMTERVGSKDFYSLVAMHNADHMQAVIDTEFPGWGTWVERE